MSEDEPRLTPWQEEVIEKIADFIESEEGYIVVNAPPVHGGRRQPS